MCKQSHLYLKQFDMDGLEVYVQACVGKASVHGFMLKQLDLLSLNDRAFGRFTAARAAILVLQLGFARRAAIRCPVIADVINARYSLSDCKQNAGFSL